MDGAAGQRRGTSSAGLRGGLGIRDRSCRRWPEGRHQTHDRHDHEGDARPPLETAVCGREWDADDQGDELAHDQQAARPASSPPESPRRQHHGDTEETEDRDLQRDRDGTRDRLGTGDAESSRLDGDVRRVDEQRDTLDSRDDGPDGQGGHRAHPGDRHGSRV